MSRKVIVTVLFLFAISVTAVKGQSADDVLRYSEEYPSYDAISLVMPGVSNQTGFGAYQLNPASMALVDKSFFGFDLSSRFVDETNNYLGNSSNYSDNQTNIGDLGFVYKVPTSRGSLVLGGGYSQTTDFNRAVSAHGRNNRSTITDFYNSPFADDSLFFAAFDVYAIDFATTDSSYSETASIFRIGFEQFPGINQDVEMTERGKLGEYSVFMSTELLKGFYVGGAIGYLSGDYTYNREFLESDRQNDYNAQFIDTDGDGNADTDIDKILSIDTIEADIEAFSARLGIIYRLNNQLQVGTSFEFPSKLNISENYNTEILTTFDNGVQFTDDAPGRFSYKIVRPARLKAGVTYKQSENLRFSLSGEGVFYSNTRIEFDSIELYSQEEAINSVVRSNFNDVINMRMGVEYDVNDLFTPRIGYAYFQNPRENIGSDRQFISGGFSAELTKGLIFDMGLQYSFWEDRNTLYETPSVSEVVQEDVSRLHVMAGIRMTL